METNLLSIQNVSKDFGGLRALSGVSFNVKKGVIKAIIGPNGAGKSTLLNCVTKIYPPSAGQVFFENKRIDHLPPHDIPRHGIARTFQIPRILGEFSVWDNVRFGAFCSSHVTAFDILLRTRRFSSDLSEIDDRVNEAIKFVGLENYSKTLAGSLPAALQRITELARAMVSQPKLLLLDEPFAGLTEHERSEIEHRVMDVHEHGCTILLIDHEVKIVFEVADEIVVLNFGQLLAEGSPDEIRSHGQVREAYLGSELKPEDYDSSDILPLR